MALFFSIPFFCATLYTNIANESQSLSDKTHLIFLSCPPVNEAKLRENTRYVQLQLT